MLKNSSFDCIFCSSDLEALEIIKNSEISGLVTDLIMPNISGIDLMKAVNEYQLDCFKFLITGDVNLDIIIFSINEVKIDQILIKPININGQALQKTVESLLTLNKVSLNVA